MEAVRFFENRQHYMVEPEETESQPKAASSIQLEALKELTLALLKEVEALEHAQPSGGKQQISLPTEVRRFESEMIRWALARTAGHQRRAARLLGLKVTTLHAKIKRYPLGSYAQPDAPATTDEHEATDAPATASEEASSHESPASETPSSESEAA
ncbi:MAG TPA: helix-turn-helix domain-containing protein [Pyrinomonadaceae bacterium]|nr:helix-turn-helix domain-containing protein [Pyrinomonadaceae bacterium]